MRIQLVSLILFKRQKVSMSHTFYNDDRVILKVLTCKDIYLKIICIIIMSIRSSLSSFQKIPP